MHKSIGPIPVEAAKKYGENTAVILPDRKMSFIELNSMSNRFANALVDLGVQGGDRVTLYSSNSVC
mgnify:FL=1|tara:strand:+ start:750 stop:947 length:198 start_codon:yes stop_codon:yes gene_type:complete